LNEDTKKLGENDTLNRGSRIVEENKDKSSYIVSSFEKALLLACNPILLKSTMAKHKESQKMSLKRVHFSTDEPQVCY